MHHQEKSQNCLGNGKTNKNDILNTLYILLTCNVKVFSLKIEIKKIVITHFMLDRTVSSATMYFKKF